MTSGWSSRLKILFWVEGAKVRAWVWPTALLLSVAPVLTWAVAASLADHRLFEALFFDQHVGRVTKADRHPGPWWKHAAHLLPLLLPVTPPLHLGALEECDDGNTTAGDGCSDTCQLE